MLGEVDLGDAALGRVLVVDLFAVDQENHIRVLLDGARLAQVGHHRLLLGARLDAAIELRQRDHRYLQFLGQCLEAAGNLGNFGSAVFLGARHLHELQVIDDDQVEPVLAGNAPRPRAQLGRRQAGRLVNKDPGFGELAGCRRDPHPIFVGNLPAADAIERHAADRAQHAREQLLGGHFHAEDGDRGARARVHRHILRNVHRQGGLAHRRAAGDDHQVTGT